MLPDQDNHNTITYKQQKQKFIISLHFCTKKSTLDESSYLVKYNFTKHIGVGGPNITVKLFPVLLKVV